MNTIMIISLTIIIISAIIGFILGTINYIQQSRTDIILQKMKAEYDKELKMVNIVLKEILANDIINILSEKEENNK